MPKVIPSRVKLEAIRLRVEQRLGLRAICKRTGLSKGTASVLLRKFPLNEGEVRERRASAADQTNAARVRYAPELSGIARLVAGQRLSGARKGRIAEAAVLLRLTLFGFEAWRDAFEGNPVDWLVTRPGISRYVRLQVRWAKHRKCGRPYVSARASSSHKELTLDTCDFLVGYDLETDTAFVIPVAERPGKTVQCCRPEWAEAWYLLGL